MLYRFFEALTLILIGAILTIFSFLYYYEIKKNKCAKEHSVYKCERMVVYEPVKENKTND